MKINIIKILIVIIALNSCSISDSYKKPTITFHPNGGVGNMPSMSLYPGNGEYLNKNTFTRDGYIFIGWSTNVAGTGEYYLDESRITMKEESFNLYAIWIEDRPFRSKWRVDNNLLRIPFDHDGKYDFIIDWGDGNSETILGYLEQGSIEHRYDTNGDYDVTISGVCVGFGNRSFSTTQEGSLLDVMEWGSVQLHSNGSQFSDYPLLAGFSALDILDTSRVTDMGRMFNGSISFNGNISQWNVSKVADMGWMFSAATSFSGDISNWNVSNVNNMRGMFSSASSFNGDLSKWDVSKVTDMDSMFSQSPFNGDISIWNVSNVTSMYMMFNSSSFSGDISKWDVSKVTDMGYMFTGAAAFNSDISGWDVSNVTTMSWMFRGASSFNKNLSSWNTTNVTSMELMFEGSPLEGSEPSWYIP